uniref:Uncharacterized protein n=1 Tax=Alexandrium monilatum TaxID=311494 RepID=A0A7S4S9L6_9DINO
MECCTHVPQEDKTCAGITTEMAVETPRNVVRVGHKRVAAASGDTADPCDIELCNEMSCQVSCQPTVRTLRSSDKPKFQGLTLRGLPERLRPSPDPGFPLADVMLIVVGAGAEAEELRRRRLAAGGHLCVLQTERLPRGATVSDGYFWRTPHAQGHFIEQTGTQRSNTVVQPGQAKDSCLPESWNIGTPGPDVHVLEAGEEYVLIFDESGERVGTYVMDRDGMFLWGISGKVVLTGDALTSLGGACDTMEKARAEDVSVTNEEAKAYVTVRPLWAAVWSFIYVCTLVPFFMVGAEQEPRLDGSGLPLWSAWLGILAPQFSIGGTENGITGAQTGVHLPRDLSYMTATLATAVITPVYIFAVDVGGTRYNKATFLTAVALTTVSMPVVAAIQFLAPRLSRRVRQSVRPGKWAWKRQALWALWVLNSSLGS